MKYKNIFILFTAVCLLHHVSHPIFSGYRGMQHKEITEANNTRSPETTVYQDLKRIGKFFAHKLLKKMTRKHQQKTQQ